MQFKSAIHFDYSNWLLVCRPEAAKIYSKLSCMCLARNWSTLLSNTGVDSEIFRQKITSCCVTDSCNKSSDSRKASKGEKIVSQQRLERGNVTSPKKSAFLFSTTSSGVSQTLINDVAQPARLLIFTFSWYQHALWSAIDRLSHTKALWPWFRRRSKKNETRFFLLKKAMKKTYTQNTLFEKAREVADKTVN